MYFSAHMQIHECIFGETHFLLSKKSIKLCYTMSIESQLERILAEVISIKAMLPSLVKEDDLSNKVYDTADILKMLKISRRTLANYRANGSLSFSKCNGRIFFTHKDLESFLKKNHFKSFSHV